MPEPDLDAIKARADAATPGPWCLYDGWGPADDDRMRFIAIGSHTQPDYIVATEPDSRDVNALREDAEFIAHAREDIPALLDFIHQLATDGGNRAAAYWLRAHDAERQRDEAETEADRLRGLLAEAEAGRDRANQRLGNLSISLNDSLAPEVKRQKAEAWDECRAWEREKARHERRWNETEGEYVPPHQFHDDDYNPYRGQP